MDIIHSLDFTISQNTIVCIGKFDGIHLGHRKIIDYALSHKGQNKLVLFTFDGMGDSTIYTRDEKMYLANKLGVDIFIELNFDEKFRQITAESFVEDLLINRCKAVHAVIGDDFAFGYQRKGNKQFLSDRLSTIVFEKVHYKGEPISSTRIREAIIKGEMNDAIHMLGEPFYAKGKVVMGNQIGRTLSMPTANQYWQDEKIIPPKGVYASVVYIDGQRFAGVSNYGMKPTIPGKRKALLETHIIDFDEDIYGKEIVVGMTDFLRSEQKFESLEQLKQTMSQDKLHALAKVKHLIK